MKQQKALIYTLGLVSAFLFPTSFLIEGDYDFPATLITIGVMRCAAPLFVLVLVIGWVWTHVIKNRSATILSTLWLVAIIGVPITSYIYNDELTNLREIIFFRQHRGGFEDLISLEDDLGCPEDQLECLSADLSPDVRVWLEADKTILVERNSEGKLAVLAVSSRKIFYTYFEDLSERPYTHFHGSETRFDTRLRQYSVNCYYQLGKNWYLCSFAYN